MKGKKQLEKQEVDWSRELSIVGMHVEHVFAWVADTEVHNT